MLYFHCFKFEAGGELTLTFENVYLSAFDHENFQSIRSRPWPSFRRDRHACFPAGLQHNDSADKNLRTEPDDGITISCGDSRARWPNRGGAGRWFD